MKNNPKLPAHPTSVNSSWALVIANAFQAQGGDSVDLFSHVGLDLHALHEPQGRLPVTVTTRLWKRAVEILNNPAFGLEVSKYVNLTTFHALSFVMIASPTRYEMFQRVSRHHRLISNAAKFELIEHADELELQWYPFEGAAPACEESVDAFMSLMVRSSQALSINLYDAGDQSQQNNPTKVLMKRQTPVNEEPYNKVFRCPIIYSAPTDSIFFDLSSAFKTTLTGNDLLAHQLDDLISQHLETFQERQMKTQIQTILIEQLPQGEPTQEKIAKQLHMSLRKLQRILKAENTSYKEILEETRKTLAKQYIIQNEIQLNDIAYLLGFNDPSSFFRAFKRWTGYSPRRYRQHSSDSHPAN